MTPQLISIAGQIRRVINRSIILGKRSILHHEELRLYPSEIHLLQVILEEADLSAGEMARKLGLSNGAVSQTLGRLEKKGVIQKTKDPALKNKVTATCTDTGKAALRIFEERQEEAMKAFAGYLNALSQKDRNVIDGFLLRMEAFLKSLA
jgi:DNA-binding MarR family transcriptional regulator